MKLHLGCAELKNGVELLYLWNKEVKHHHSLELFPCVTAIHLVPRVQREEHIQTEFLLKN